MLKTTLAIALAIGTLASGPAQDQDAKPSVPATITLSANSSDTKSVLHSLFSQAQKNYVLEPGVYPALNLALKDVEFEEALQIVLKLANLKCEIQNDIWFLARSKAAPPKEAPKPVAETKPQPKAPPQPRGKLPITALNKIVLTRFDKIDIRALFADLTRQTGVPFEIEPDVPGYKLDAYLINTSLKYALDTVTRAAQLTYELNDDLGIRIKRAKQESRVQVVPPGKNGA